jgi:hypothetical protein
VEVPDKFGLVVDLLAYKRRFEGILRPSSTLVHDRDSSYRYHGEHGECHHDFDDRIAVLPA